MSDRTGSGDADGHPEQARTVEPTARLSRGDAVWHPVDGHWRVYAYASLVDVASAEIHDEDDLLEFGRAVFSANEWCRARRRAALS